jgi:hypothetical protein
LIDLFWIDVLYLEGTCRLQKHEKPTKLPIKNPTQRNPPPHTVRCALSVEEGPTFEIQTKDKKSKTKKKIKRQKHRKQKQPIPRVDNNPVGGQIFRNIRRIEKRIPIGVV